MIKKTVLVAILMCFGGASVLAQVPSNDQLEQVRQFIDNSADVTSEDMKNALKGINLPDENEIKSFYKESQSKNADAIDLAEKKSKGYELPVFKGLASDQERQKYKESVQGKQQQAMQSDYLGELLSKYNRAQEKVLKKAQTDEADVPKESLLIFVSFSMPTAVLKNLAKQAKEAGATLVLRGMAGNSLAKTKELAREVNRAGSQWMVHPELYQLFKVKTVPTFVLTGDKEIMDEGCIANTSQKCSAQNSYAAVSGDLSVKLALDTIRRNADAPYIKHLAQKKIQQLEDIGRSSK